VTPETKAVAAPVDGGTARTLEVRGVVQGVGFRPFVWRLAARHRIRGWVRNDGGLVTIHAEGTEDALEAFATGLRVEAPPLARVEDVVVVAAAPEGFPTFEVDLSTDGASGVRLVSPDAATCAACLEELFDPDDRRYRYPFINCTDCGPRFTIIESLPYDRERTSMHVFPMCADCRREYEDPADRRFHAEPVACPACGPRLSLIGADDDRDPLRAAAALLRAGDIVAVKGLGGFHLACDATNAQAVAALRERKRRPDKPFAVMVATLEDARRWFNPTPFEAEALASWRAPIVLVADRGLLAEGVAPGHRRQGAMLPSTPLHHLLTRESGVPLVMTSGNATDEPICITDADAFERLAPIADAFLVHDRAIVARYDDSLVRVRTGEDRPTVFRRARSLAPYPLPLARPVPRPVLGTGAELHGAFCLASGTRAFLSQHVGDLDTDEAMGAFRQAYDRARKVLRVEPEVVAHDLHPDLMTTRFAETLGLPREAVQHHHAHVAATMAEHGLEGEVLGLAFDGLGYGDDGTIWGGELLVADLASARRVGRLRPVRQPGGDAATRAPWRMALAHAAAAGLGEEALAILSPPHEEATVVIGQLSSGLGSPWTSSAGRLFDAVAALLGVCRERATYEGQPAMLLEQAADRAEADPWEVPVVEEPDSGLLQLDTRGLLGELIDGLHDACGAPELAARFHASLSEAAADLCRAARDRTGGLDRVVLGGGVFQNDLFTSQLVARLSARGFRVFLPREVPVGDGGIALGQVAVAAARMEAS
jgi:hydrogenase maturation protein HypF